MPYDRPPKTLTVMSRSLEAQRKIVLSKCLDLSRSLQILRNRWSRAGGRERQEIVAQAQEVKELYEQHRTKYISLWLENADSFQQSVISYLF